MHIYAYPCMCRHVCMHTHLLIMIFFPYLHTHIICIVLCLYLLWYFQYGWCIHMLAYISIHTYTKHTLIHVYTVVSVVTFVTYFHLHVEHSINQHSVFTPWQLWVHQLSYSYEHTPPIHRHFIGKWCVWTVTVSVAMQLVGPL